MVCITFDGFYTNSYVVFVLYASCYLYHVFYVHDNLLVKLSNILIQVPVVCCSFTCLMIGPHGSKSWGFSTVRYATSKSLSSSPHVPLLGTSSSKREGRSSIASLRVTHGLRNHCPPAFSHASFEIRRCNGPVFWHVMSFGSCCKDLE
jgi:hypothetical protein